MVDNKIKSNKTNLNKVMSYFRKKANPCLPISGTAKAQELATKSVSALDKTAMLIIVRPIFTKIRLKKPISERMI